MFISRSAPKSYAMGGKPIVWLVVVALISLVVGFHIHGCTRARSAMEYRMLVGTYRATLPDGAVEFLELKTSGECSQEVQLRDGRVFRAQGQWWYNDVLNYVFLRGPRIAPSPMHKLNPGISEVPNGITAALPVLYTTSGDVVLKLSVTIDFRKEQ
jgi:hypothetical protein